MPFINLRKPLGHCSIIHKLIRITLYFLCRNVLIFKSHGYPRTTYTYYLQKPLGSYNAFVYERH